MGAEFSSRLKDENKRMTWKGKCDKIGSEYALPNVDHLCVVSCPKRR